MLRKLIHKVVGDPNERELKRLQPIVDQINELEPKIKALSDEQLRQKTEEFRARLRGGETLDDLLPEAFAVVREASRRTIGLRHYDVQLIGGIVLHQGKIAEMKTGEGKTLVATLPLYLNALLGRGAHLVTPNDYLAKYGVQWMGPIYHFLGLKVAVIQSQTEDGVHQPAFVYDPDYISDDDRYVYLRPIPRREAYLADITYGTNNEFGFDYLRDNMVRRKEQRVQRELYYAIVDEIDNILIDEARTPLIISGPAEEPSELYELMAKIVRNFRGIDQRRYEELMEAAKLGDEEAIRELNKYDYVVDEKSRIAAILEPGIAKAERALGVDNLYAEENFELTHYLDNAIRAKALYHRDRDYIVTDEGQVIIVDEFTGRLMYGRRFSEGLHQAIEAKEGVPIQRENLTLATITYQNFFRMYEKLAGMTGTAYTEAEEFQQIYGLDVVVIPTHRPVIREDYPDVIYKTEAAKFNAVVREIIQMHVRGRPVLVGTASIERSEHLSRLLTASAIQQLALRDLRKFADEEDEEGRRRTWTRKGLFKPETLKQLAELWEIEEEHMDKLIEVLQRGVPHEVLNAKHHEREAEIIAQAGRPYAVTIATNMAGRGVDILLGGNPEGLARRVLRKKYGDLTQVPEEEFQAEVERQKALVEKDRELVLKLGGLHVIGTERHEARRIDNQLRGRAGRQGDPGSSRFYVSLEDEIIRNFGGQSLQNLMDRLGFDEDYPLEHRAITKAIENAQVKVEGYNFDVRKRVLEFDNVVNKQREVIYEQRATVLEAETLRPEIERMFQERLHELVSAYLEPADYEQEPDPQGLYQAVRAIMPLPPHVTPDRWAEMSPQEVEEELWAIFQELYDRREEEFGAEIMRDVERQLMLDVVDNLWIHHLTALDALRTGIGLRAFGQQDPLVAFKREAYELFQQLIRQIEDQVIYRFFRVQPVVISRAAQPREMHMVHGGDGGSADRQGGGKRKKKKKRRKKKLKKATVR